MDVPLRFLAKKLSKVVSFSWKIESPYYQTVTYRSFKTLGHFGTFLNLSMNNKRSVNKRSFSTFFRFNDIFFFEIYICCVKFKIRHQRFFYFFTSVLKCISKLIKYRCTSVQILQNNLRFKSGFHSFLFSFRSTLKACLQRCIPFCRFCGRWILRFCSRKVFLRQKSLLLTLKM